RAALLELIEVLMELLVAFSCDKTRLRHSQKSISHGDTIAWMKTAFLTVLLCAGVVVAESAAPPTPFFQGNGVVASFRSFEDDAGGFYIAWADEGVGESNTLRAQHVGPKGEHLWQADGLVVTSSLLSLKDWSGLAD